MKSLAINLSLTIILTGVLTSFSFSQITIGEKTVITPNTIFYVNNFTNLRVTDTLINRGTLQAESTSVTLQGTSPVFRNEDTVLIFGNLTSLSGEITNATGPGGFFAVTGNVLLNGNSSLQNFSSQDTFHVSQDMTLSGNAQLINQGGVFNVENNLSTLTTTTNIINQGFLRIAGDYDNNGNYGVASDTGTIRLVGSTDATFSNGSNPVYHLWLNTTAIKTLASNVTIKNRLSLFNGIIETTASHSLLVDSLAVITRPTPFNPTIGGHVQGTMSRYVEQFVGVDQLDSLYFPVGINGHFAPFLIRNMSPQGENALFTIQTLTPSPGTGSFDVAVPLNSAITWRKTVVNKPSQYVISAGADISLIGTPSTDTLVIAQSSSASGSFSSLGKTLTLTNPSLRGITSEFQPDAEFITIGSSKNVKLSLKVLLQGRSDGLGAMNTNSTFTDTLQTRFNAQIIEAYRPIPTSVIDSVSVSIRTSPSGPDIETIPAWLMADGSIRDYRTITDTSITFARAENLPYFIVVRHRNHLTLMSSATINLISNSRGQTDLTQISNIFGGGVYAVTGTIGAMYAGNTRNIDQEVNAGDQFDAVFGNANLLPGYDRRDADLNAVINAADITLADEGSFSLYFSTTP